MPTIRNSIGLNIANDPLDAANDNPPKLTLKVVECPLRLVGGPARFSFRIDASWLVRWIELYG